MKRAFIKYSSVYGGQAFKQKDKRKAFLTVMDFLTASTIFEKPEKVEMNIFETPESEIDKTLVSDFEKIFGAGVRTLYAQYYEGGNEMYCWKWILPFEKVDKCLEWFEQHQKFSNFFMQPTLTINFDFKWKAPKAETLLPFQEVEYFDSEYNSRSHLLLFLSKTNSVILDLNFPFETINEDFATLKENILKQLPIELKEKYFRLWTLCKDNETYKERKI